MKLNLGCQDDIKKGFLNIDKFIIGLQDKNIVNNKNVMIYDLNFLPLPFNNNSIDYINCEHLLPYLNSPGDFMLELWRICKPKAKIKLIVPHFSLPMAYAELYQKRSGYSYFMLGNENWNRFLFDKFKVVNKKINFTRINYKFLNYIFNPFINAFPMLYERFFCYLLPSSEIIFDLEVVK